MYAGTCMYVSNYTFYTVPRAKTVHVHQYPEQVPRYMYIVYMMYVYAQYQYKMHVDMYVYPIGSKVVELKILQSSGIYFQRNTVVC